MTSGLFTERCGFSSLFLQVWLVSSLIRRVARELFTERCDISPLVQNEWQVTLSVKRMTSGLFIESCVISSVLLEMITLTIRSECELIVYSLTSL